MTPHIEANLEDIAKIVIISGDPLRTKYLANKYLKNKKLVNKVRYALAYTGFLNNKKITFFSSGMGSASMGIYAYELYKFYQVEYIIRIGTCGSLKPHISVSDIVCCEQVASSSNFASNFLIESSVFKTDMFWLNIAEKINLKKVSVYSTDAFYGVNNEITTKNYDVVEMETFSLYVISKIFNKKAFAIFKVSDSVINKNAINLSPEEREKSFNSIIKIIKNLLNFI